MKGANARARGRMVETTAVRCWRQAAGPAGPRKQRGGKKEDKKIMTKKSHTHTHSHTN